MFEQLISPEQKRLAATVGEKGAEKTLRNTAKMLLELVKTSSMAAGAEGRWALWAEASGANPNADELRTVIFEGPDAAVEKNQVRYSRKFEAQQHQIIYELKSLIQRRKIDQSIAEPTILRESDRRVIINEVISGPHDQIRDRVCVSTLCENAYSLLVGVLSRQSTRFGGKW